MKDDSYKLIGLYLLAVAAILLWLCSCKTSSSVTIETTNIRDSIRITDSVRLIDSTVTKTQIVDSVRLRDSTVLILDADSNIKVKYVYRDRDHYHSETDSTAYYKRLLHDALQQHISDADHDKQQKQVVVRKPSFWEHTRYFAVGLIMGIIMACCTIYAAMQHKDNPS